jgi:hypothetical protein
MIFPNQALIEIASIATWEKNKVAMTAAIGIWCINIVFLIQGKCLPPLPTSSLLMWFGNRCRAGEQPISIISNSLSYYIHSFALCGYPPNRPVSRPIPRAVYSISSPCSSLTSSYFSLCSVVCFVCAATVVARLA